MKMKYSFMQSEYRNSSPRSSLYHIIPVPFESTVSYGGGTALGPEAVLEASYQLEKLVEGLDEPGIYGMYTAEPVDCKVINSPLEVFNRTAELMEQAVSNNSVPLLLGGEHSITNAAVELISRLYNPGEIGIIQFDAHMDLRDSYEGSKWSHASVMRRAAEAGIPLYQVGIRNYSQEELDARKQFSIHSCDASKIHQLRYSQEGLREVSLPVSFPQKVYITFDVDCFDSSLMPATGTPEPGGLAWWDTLELLRRLSRGRIILGADVVELAPIPSLHHCSYTAAKLVYFIMGLASPGLSHHTVL